MSQTEEKDPAFEALLDYLRQSRGFDFGVYKRSSLVRRVRARMRVMAVASFEDYLDYLEVHPDEFNHLFNTILINVTSFFRDAPPWDYLAQEIIPVLLRSKPAYEPIRVWSAGCASGEEIYSVAILLAEALDPAAFHQRVKIYATDIDEEALAQARQASYSAKQLEAVSAEWRDKYFELNGNRYVFRPDLRRSIIFGRHDLVQDAPISRLDLLLCRNTLMYFNAEAQARILARFHFALNTHGFLFLGKAEMLLTHGNLFTPLELRHRIFAKVVQPNLRDHLLLLTQAGNEEAGYRLGRNVRLREAAFDAVTTAQIVIDLNGALVLANVLAQAMFGLSAEDLGRPFRDLELSYRPIELRSLIDKIYQEQQVITLTNVSRPLVEGILQHLEVQLTPLYDNGQGLLGVSITFNDVTRSQQLQMELQRANQELETAYEELQSANEELETTNEELQSTVEELETTNEELQSTNEELETMNEELHSSNEELQATNNELYQLTTELHLANAFLNSILTGLRDGVIVVDSNFSILQWNYRSEDLWGLRAKEVQGQSLFNLDIGLPVEQLKEPLRTCLAGETNRQEIKLKARNRRGKAIECLVTCTPLLGLHQEHQGVILMVEEWKL